MTTFVVSSAAGLMAAVAKAQGGDNITLTGGTYSAVNLANIHPSSNVTISSQNSAHPVYFTQLNVNTCSNLVFSQVGVDASSTIPNSSGGANTWIVNVIHGDNITFNHVTARGLTDVGLNNAVSAISIGYSTNTTISQSSFQYFHNAVSIYRSTGFNGASNSFSHIFDDGFHGGGTSNVNISGNTFTDFHEDASDTDHPDTIQFFTQGQTASASNFYFANNTYTRGDGNAVQGIFFRDEVGNLPFHYITAINNSYTGANYNGITVADGTSVNISNNTLMGYSDYSTKIALQETANATIQNNSANAYSYTNVTGLQSTGNVTTKQLATPANPAATFVSMTVTESPLDSPMIPSPVPEPTAWITVILGMLMVGTVLRRSGRRVLAETKLTC